MNQYTINLQNHIISPEGKLIAIALTQEDAIDICSTLNAFNNHIKH